MLYRYAAAATEAGDLSDARANEITLRTSLCDRTAAFGRGGNGDTFRTPMSCADFDYLIGDLAGAPVKMWRERGSTTMYKSPQSAYGWESAAVNAIGAASLIFGGAGLFVQSREVDQVKRFRTDRKAARLLGPNGKRALAREDRPLATRIDGHFRALEWPLLLRRCLYGDDEPVGQLLARPREQAIAELGRYLTAQPAQTAAHE